MRTSTHTDYFLRFKLKLVVTCCSISTSFCTNLIFVTILSDSGGDGGSEEGVGSGWRWGVVQIRGKWFRWGWGSASGRAGGGLPS